MDVRFFEDGGDKDAYSNMIDYLYNEAGEKMVSMVTLRAE